MGFIGSFIYEPQENENIEALYENKIESAYFYLANIHTNLLPDMLISGNNLLNVEELFLGIIFYIYENELSRNEDPISFLNTIQIILPLENKDINVGKLWEYCYINSKEPLKQEMKIRLFRTLPAGSWEITDDLPDSYTIELEDI